MTMHKSITEERITEACESDDHMGFCIKCGADAYGVEPDAREYECEACGEQAVFGAQELLFVTVG